jgi:hypothetical protein
MRIAPKMRFPICSVCNEPVELETSKTDAHGKAVHEECPVFANSVLLRHWCENSSEHGKQARSILRRLCAFVVLVLIAILATIHADGAPAANNSLGTRTETRGKRRERGPR